MTQRQLKAVSEAPAAYCAGPMRERSYSGFILLDHTGAKKGHSDSFEQFLLANGISNQGNAWESIFPAGCSPAELIARDNPEQQVSAVLFAGEDGLPVRLRLESTGENWLLFLSFGENSRSLPRSEWCHLVEQQSTRAAISSYLHDTVCQNLVGVSMLLAKAERDPATAGSSSVQRAVKASEACAREVRTLMRVLSPVEFDAGPSSLDEIREYVSELRERAGIDVSLRIDPAGRSGIGPAGFTLLTAAIQKWAEATLSARTFGTAKTTISIELALTGVKVEFASDLTDDPAIAGLAGSDTVRLCLEERGGGIRTFQTSLGCVARILLGSEEIR